MNFVNDYLSITGVMFVTAYFAKMSRYQVFLKIKKDDLELQLDDSGKPEFLRISRDLTDDDTDCMIPFKRTNEGLSPAQFILDWMKKLDPDCPFMFQTTKRTSKQLNIEGNPDIW